MSAHSDYGKLLKEYKKRGLKPFHVFIASSLALFRRYGALNLGVMTITMEEVGRRLAAIALGEDPGLRSVDEAVEALNRMLELNSRLTVSVEGDGIVVRSGSETCRICPRGVGELELPGSLCPYIGLIRGFLASISGVELELADPQEPVKKDGGDCVIEYKVLRRP